MRGKTKEAQPQLYLRGGQGLLDAVGQTGQTREPPQNPKRRKKGGGIVFEQAIDYLKLKKRFADSVRDGIYDTKEGGVVEIKNGQIAWSSGDITGDWLLRTSTAPSPPPEPPEKVRGLSYTIASGALGKKKQEVPYRRIPGTTIQVGRWSVMDSVKPVPGEKPKRDNLARMVAEARQILAGKKPR